MHELDTSLEDMKKNNLNILNQNYFGNNNTLNQNNEIENTLGKLYPNAGIPWE